jgi:hypothetical protein
MEGMSPVRRIAFAIVVGSLVAGCGFVPMLDGDAIVIEVANHSPRPVPLVVAAPGEIQKIVGAANPAIVPAGATVTARFSVPRSGSWAIWANGGELIGDLDVKGRRGPLPIGIDIDPNGDPSWWCRDNCP